MELEAAVRRWRRVWKLPVRCNGVKSVEMGLVEGRECLQSALWGAGAGATPQHESSQQQPSIVTMAMPAVLRLSSVVTSSTCWGRGCRSVHNLGGSATQNPDKNLGSPHRMGRLPQNHQGPSRMGFQRVTLWHRLVPGPGDSLW